MYKVELDQEIIDKSDPILKQIRINMAKKFKQSKIKTISMITNKWFKQLQTLIIIYKLYI